MKVISKEVSAHIAAMAVVNSEKAALGPLLASILLRLWLHDIEDNGDSVFIVVPHDSLVGVSTVSSDDSVAFHRVFGILIVWHDLLQRIICHCFQLLLEFCVKALGCGFFLRVGRLLLLLLLHLLMSLVLAIRNDLHITFGIKIAQGALAGRIAFPQRLLLVVPRAS